MMAGRYLRRQFAQASITNGAINIFRPCGVAGGKFEGCKAGVKSEIQKGLSR